MVVDGLWWYCWEWFFFWLRKLVLVFMILVNDFLAFYFLIHVVFENSCCCCRCCCSCCCCCCCCSWLVDGCGGKMIDLLVRIELHIYSSWVRCYIYIYICYSCFIIGYTVDSIVDSIVGYIDCLFVCLLLNYPRPTYIKKNYTRWNYSKMTKEDGCIWIGR